MSDEISVVSPIAVDRTNQDHPRRNPHQGGRREPGRRPVPTPTPAPAPAPETGPGDAPVVGSRLNVRV